jgi:protein transport protein SEC24
VVHNVPKKSIFPLGAWITPFGADNVPSVNVHSPLRCHRCKAYVNPYFQFDGSRKMATCNICGMKFQIDENIDRKNMEATEVATKGVIDFVVKDKFYHLKRTDIVKIIICIELSQVTIELGIFNTVIESIKSSIENSSFE